MCDQILQAVRRLLHHQPADQITMADIARVVGVHWSTGLSPKLWYKS